MKRRRRLLSIGHAYAVTMNRRLAHEVARVDPEGWEVTAVAPTRFKGSNDLRAVRLAPGADEPSRLVPVHAYLTGRVHVFTYGASLRPLLAEPWDLVHCWEEPYVLAGGQIAWWLRPRVPLVFHTAQNLNKSYPVPFNWIERYAMGRAAGWIASGRLVEENLKPRVGYAGLASVEIPLGTDIARFRPDKVSGAAVRRALGWDERGPTVCRIPRTLRAREGSRVAAARARRNQVTLAGSLRRRGPTGEAATSSLGPTPRRPRSDLHRGRSRRRPGARLNAMDILCAPSQAATPRWREQFGRMLVEAFACGVAVIGSDSGEIPHVIRDSGMVVGERDEAGWANAIAILIEDRAHRDDLVARGLQRARDEFAWPVVAARRICASTKSLLAGA